MNFKFKIVTDSSSNVMSLAATEKIVFASVPLKIQTAERDFVDTPELDTDEMLSYLAQYKGKSGSSCPNTAEWEKEFDGADNIFCITITSGLSGSYNSAFAAAKEHLEAYPEKKIYVIDTLSVGPEAALIIDKLCSLISKGLTFEQIVDEIKKYQKKHICFSPSAHYITSPVTVESARLRQGLQACLT